MNQLSGRHTPATDHSTILIAVFVFITTLGYSLLLPPLSHANQALGKLLKNKVAESLIFETNEGLELKELLGAKNWPEFVQRLEALPSGTAKQELIESINHSATYFDSIQANPRQSLTLKKFAAKRLILATDFKKWLKFRTRDVPPRALEARSYQTLEPYEPSLFGLPNLPSNYSAITTISAESGEFFSPVKSLFSNMKSCLAHQDATEAKKQQLKYMLKGLAISESFTLGGYLISTGGKEVSLKDISVDLLVTGLHSVATGFLSSGQTRWYLRWLRVVAIGEGRAGVDAIIYYLHPENNTHGLTKEDATWKRLQFNSSWSLGSSIIPVSVYSLVGGLECLFPSRSTSTATTAIRLGASAASSIGYFTIRKNYFDSIEADQSRLQHFNY